MYSSVVEEQGFEQFLHSGHCRVPSISELLYGTTIQNKQA